MGRFVIGAAHSTEKDDQKEESRLSGFTFDAGAMIALDRHDRQVLSMVARSKEYGYRITIPTTALAQAIRSPRRQAVLSRLIRSSDADIVPLNKGDATEIGTLLARSATADIVDAHVVICAGRAGQPVVTSDAGGLKLLIPSLKLISI